MIFKPSELTPLSTLYLAEALVEAGAPSGTFQVLQGKGDVAEKLLTHPLLKKASLTGSISTGKKVASLCGRKLIPSTLELGGKSPLLILEDADLTKSVEITLMANFYAGGEVCSNGTRVFVPKAKILEFTKLLKKRVEELPLGDPFDKQTLIGSLISKAHKEKVYNYVQRALQEGATLVSGHNLIKLPQALEEGAFYPPTILTDVFDDFEICKEEVFGPVVTLLSYDHEDELVERANKTEGGLGAGIITNNLQKAHRIAQLLQAGIIWVNTYNQTPLEVEFGGMKESGIGRENGLEVLNHYTQTKTIFFDLDEKSLFP
jgi:betaine-aldehyde dehydrogenase